MTVTENNLRILLANEREDELRDLAAVLERLGHEVTPFAVSVADAIELIAREDPDLTFVIFDGDDAHGLALISETVEFASGPVLVTMREVESSQTVAQAADMGIAGYVDSWAPDDVQGAIEVAMARHRDERRLHEKVAQLESALERRAVIERAKGVLMERHQVDDRQAFELLRDHARSGGQRVVDVAQSVLDGHALLPRSRE
jgi:AmiR/NasT family two-component response regulator